MTYQEYRVTYMSSNNDWKLPLNLAIGFHILVALSTVLFPLLFKSKPEFVDIYSVNLVNMEEPAAPSAPPPAAAPAKTQSQPPPAPTPPKVIEKTAAPVKIPPKEAVPVAAEQPPAEVAPPAPLKAISLKPIKRKVKKEAPPEDTVQREAEKREREIERQNRQQLAESLRAEQDAAEEARLAAEAAEAERNRMEQTRQRLSQIRSSIQSSSSSTTSSTSATQGGGGSTSALDAQYYAAVAARIQPFFQLPEIKTFDPTLVTIVIITITNSGEVADTQIESSSGDALYDQFVLKSIAAANPLPPIPPALRKQRIEMGLKFSPGGIQ